MTFWNFIKNQDESVELRIDGEIIDDSWAWIYEWFGDPYASPNKFRQELAKHKGKTLTVWIDSWGGDVFAGIGMYNALKEHDGKVIVKIDGKAVSAGTIPAMAADPGELWMTPGSILMAHNPWTRTVGESKDMRHTADVLDEVKEAIINVYQLKTGKSREELAVMMDRETWMSAKTAVAEGFADGILYTETDEPAQNAYTLSGLAIQNSADKALQKFFEVWQKHNKPPEETPAENSRVFNIKKRVNVREKQNRRYTHGKTC